MNKTDSIFIQQNICLNCCRCVRSCTVKSIRFENDSASILTDRCIACGECYEACPSGVVKISDHIRLAEQAIKNNQTIVASLSSAWVSEFKGIEPSRMVEVLKLLGFTHVSETTLGATAVASQTVKTLASSGSASVSISSICPVVNSLVTKYYPLLSSHLTPVCTPTIAHARLIRQWYGDKARVVTISSCVAAKDEVHRDDGLISAALTFEELKKWMVDSGVDFEFVQGHDSYSFEPFSAQTDVEYVMERGIFDSNASSKYNLPDLQFFSLSGLHRVNKILASLRGDTLNRPIYLELFACEGGCLHGVGSFNKIDFIDKKIEILKYAESARKNPLVQLPLVYLAEEFKPEDVLDNITDEDIADALSSISINFSDEPINCGGCGYNDCHSFAKAMVRGDVTSRMCVWYLKKVAQDKFSVLLNKMPFGVFVVNDNLKIVEANKNFATLMGAEAEMLYSSGPGMSGVDFARLAPFSDLVSELLCSQEDLLERDVQVKERVLTLSMFTLLKGHLVCGMVRNMFLTDVRNDEIMARTRAVINDNLETVQKIAYLLGENASRTEAILNSIVESQKLKNE